MSSHRTSSSSTTTTTTTTAAATTIRWPVWGAGAAKRMRTKSELRMRLVGTARIESSARTRSCRRPPLPPLLLHLSRSLMPLLLLLLLLVLVLLVVVLLSLALRVVLLRKS